MHHYMGDSLKLVFFLVFAAFICAGCGMPPEAEEIATRYMDKLMKGDYQGMYDMFGKEGQENMGRGQFIQCHEKMVRLLGKPLSYKRTGTLRSKDYGTIVYEPTYLIDYQSAVCEYGVQFIEKNGKWYAVNWSVDTIEK